MSLNISRRAVMRAMATISATGATGSALALSAPPSAPLAPEIAPAAFAGDPLASAIDAYRASMAAFNRSGHSDDESDAVAGRTFIPHMDRLADESPVATSLHGVTEAIRLTLESSALCDPVCEAVLASALAYLDRGAQS